MPRQLRHPAAALAIALGAATPALAQPAPINAIGVENQYADVIAQIGGKYVAVTAIESDPNTDPHTFEVSPKIAAQIANADLIVENGLGYDGWADKMIAAAPNAARKTINVQALLGLPANTPNPHLWYDPATMPAVAAALATDLAALRPADAAYFAANAKTFDTALKPWLTALAAFRHDFPGTPVAITEPIADDTLQAIGADMATPFTLQAAIMNGTDPSPQDVAIQNNLLAGHVKIFVYNAQVTDPLTQSFLTLAKQNKIPVVAVYETMPEPGYTYETWMLAQVTALRKAVSEQKSTETLMPETK
jgi:zinc/manganese transport system substrate-binding protein